MRLRHTPAASALLALVLLSGCDADAPPAPPADGLEAALAATPATPASTTSFGFTDFGLLDGDALEEVLQGTLGTPLQPAVMLGLDSFGNYALLVEELLPHPATADATAISIGEPPQTASRFTGVRDPAAALAHVDAESVPLGEGTLIVRREDHAVDPDDEEFPPGLLARLNVIWHDDDTIIAGTTRAAVEQWATGAAPTLDAHYAGVAACLGDVAVAGVYSAGFARTANDTAIGIVADSGAFVQTLCTRSADAAAAVAEIENRIATGTDARGTALSTLVVGAVVEDAGGGWIRVRTSDAASVSLMQLLMSGEASALIG